MPFHHFCRQFHFTMPLTIPPRLQQALARTMQATEPPQGSPVPLTPLRRAALECSLQLTMHYDSTDAAIASAVSIAQSEPIPSVRIAAMDALLEMLPTPNGRVAAPMPPVSLATLRLVVGLLHGDDPLVQHRAFVLIQRLRGVPPTLYKEAEVLDVGNLGMRMCWCLFVLL